jgi:Protein of unknown function (DUF1579)
MKIRLTAAALCLLALPALAQDKPKEPAAPAMGAAEMEAMTKAMSPGEPHKRLARMAGDWTYTNKMWMAPNQPPEDSTGTMHAETILGGRYVQTTWTGNMMGMTFEGHGTEGYDNIAKQHVSSWVDNMGTGIILSTGTCDDSGNKCSMKGDMMDPMTGKKSYMRSEMTWMDANTFKNEMYGPGPDGKEFKWMEMTVKRK